MKNQNGKTYPQNYDVIIKWMANALCGETLDVIGLKTGRIVEVFQFEPIEIAVKSGRVDVMIRDDTDKLYHVEEQRNLSKSDLYRFAAYHFMGAKKWEKMTDVIIASGNVYSGEKVLITESGKYAPIVLDLSLRDGHKTLKEIRLAVLQGDLTRILELVFVPLYGKDDKEARKALAEEVIEFEKKLHEAEKMPIGFLAATLIMANKFISKEKFNELWEEIKMLDVIEFAREKIIEEERPIWEKKGRDIGLKEGMKEGMKEGFVLSSREMLLEALIEGFGVIPESIAEKIRSINQPDTLKSLLRQALRCKELKQFAEMLNRLNDAKIHSA